MTAGEQLYDGKAKTLFAGPSEDTIIQYFKDDATAFNAAKHDIIEGKGILNNLISEHIMGYLAKNGVDNHFVERLSPREQLVRKLDIIPLEVVVRNAAAGSLIKRLNGAHINLHEGDRFSRPLLEYCLKEDGLNDPFVSPEEVTLFEITTQEELSQIDKTAKQVNILLKELYESIGIRLIDFKLEFGRTIDGEILLADEISPDSCRLWDIKTGEKKDKDRFRQDLGGFIEAYRDIATRFGIDTSILDEKGTLDEKGIFDKKEKEQCG